MNKKKIVRAVGAVNYYYMSIIFGDTLWINN